MPAEEPVNETKNMRKQESYKLAFGMMNDALDRDCPLQAIAIAESILTDRLSSTLNVGRSKKPPKDTLGKVLSEWHPVKPGTSRNANSNLFDSEMESLFPKLEAWWKERNALLHGIAKSAQGEVPEICAEEFPLRAMKAAKDGLALVRKADAWAKRQIRKSRKAATNRCED